MKKRKIMGIISGNLEKEGNLWFSEAHKLPIAAYGSTPREAMERVYSALSAYIEASDKDKELIKVLTHYDLIANQSTSKYAFRFETPVEKMQDDMVPA